MENFAECGFPGGEVSASRRRRLSGSLVEPKVKAALGRDYSVYRSEPYFWRFCPKGSIKGGIAGAAADTPRYDEG